MEVHLIPLLLDTELYFINREPCVPFRVIVDNPKPKSSAFRHETLPLCFVFVILNAIDTHLFKALFVSFL